MNQLIETNNPAAPYAFSHNGTEIENPTISECGRFHVSPEYYGFTIWQTGGGCTAHGREFTLNGQPVLMLVTNGDLCHVTDETTESTIGLYDPELNSLDINVWHVSR